MQHVRGLVNHDVAERVLGLVSGPPHVRIVSCKPIAPHLDVVRLEPMIPEQGPENPPCISHETGRQFRLNGRPGSRKVQNKRPGGDFPQRNFPPITGHQAGHHRVNALPNRLWWDRWNRPGFCREQIRKKVEQVPDGGLRRPSICLVLLELREPKAAGARPFPSLFSGAHESFDELGRQAAGRGSLPCGILNALIDHPQSVALHQFLRSAERRDHRMYHDLRDASARICVEWCPQAGNARMCTVSTQYGNR